MHVSGETIRPPGVKFPAQGGEHGVSEGPWKAAVSPGSRITVGFLGNFCSPGGPEHSVTLLTQGVAQQLDTAQFRVVVISVAGDVPEEACRQVCCCCLLC